MATGSTSRAGSWKNVGTSVSLPWTATSDGYIYADVNPNSSAIAYYYINVDSIVNWANIVARDGTRTQQFFPVVEGKTYSLGSSSNVKSVNLRFYSL